MDEPVGEAELRKIITAINDGRGSLNFSKHAFQRMDERSLDEKDCRNILRAGRWRGPDFETGTWRYRMESNNMFVVVAVRSETCLVVVTVGRLS